MFRDLEMGMSGTDVMKLQAVLAKTGHDPGPVDGVFGAGTRQAVTSLQRRFSLPQNGAVSGRTRELLERFALGYDNFTVRRGDTVYSIARAYRTSPGRVLAANPGINPQNLRVGTNLIIPYDIRVVDTNIDYTYDILQNDLTGLRARFPFIDAGAAGRSSLGRELSFVRLGRGPRRVFYNASHHSLEWITTVVMMKFIEDYAGAYADGTELLGYNPRELWEQVSIYIIPMVNPDGIDLVLNGLTPENPEYENLIKWNNGSTDFGAVWQSNNRGVDLNHNYNAMWEESKAAEAEHGINGPGPTRYSGTAPESEPESRAVADFTRNNDFSLVMAYHSQGELIFWNFMNLATPPARRIGEALAAVSGYTLDEATGIASFAGYKDWFIQDFRRPGYTIEVGLGRNPLPISQFDGIYADNLPMLLLAAVVNVE